MSVSCECDFQSNHQTVNTGHISLIWKNAFKSFKSYLEQRRQRRIDRDAFLNLMNLDDRELRDIGISKADVIWASKLPVAHNASQELQQISNKCASKMCV